MADNNYKKMKSQVRTSLTLLVLAVITITTATYAWFTIVNNSSVHDITLDVTAGAKLMIDTEFSTDMNDYTDIVDADMINAQLTANFSSTGFTEMSKLKIAPLTSGNGQAMYTQNGNTINRPSEASSGNFFELSLWFISSRDMDVYLNGQASADLLDDGTYIRSNEANNALQQPVERCARMSITPFYSGSDADNQVLSGSMSDYKTSGFTNIYEPNKDLGVPTKLSGQAKADNGGNLDQSTFVTLGDNGGIEVAGEKTPLLFTLKENIPVRVMLRLWIEGEDAQCLNSGGSINIEKAKFNALLRFCGADANGMYVE